MHSLSSGSVFSLERHKRLVPHELPRKKSFLERVDRKKPHLPESVSSLGGFQIKSPVEEDPPMKNNSYFSEGVPFLWALHVNPHKKKKPTGGGVSFDQGSAARIS